jgi:hypothetical protein
MMRNAAPKSLTSIDGEKGIRHPVAARDNQS